MKAFTMLLPPEWVLIDLQGDRRDGVRAIVAGWLQGLTPEQAAAARPILLSRMEAMTSDMATRGIAALVMQSAGLNEVGVQPSLVVRPMEIPEDAQPLDLLVALAGSDSTAEILDVNHLVGLKTSRVEKVGASVDNALDSFPPDLRSAASQPDKLPLLATLGIRVAHRSQYMLGVPDDRSSWVELYGSVEVSDDLEGEALADAYGQMFDALASTFDWRD